MNHKNSDRLSSVRAQRRLHESYRAACTNAMGSSWAGGWVGGVKGIPVQLD